MWNFLLELSFCFYLVDWASYDSDPTNPFWDDWLRTNIRTCYPEGHYAKIECIMFSFVYLFVCLSFTSRRQLRAYGDRATALNLI